MLTWLNTSHTLTELSLSPKNIITLGEVGVACPGTIHTPFSTGNISIKGQFDNTLVCPVT